MNVDHWTRQDKSTSVYEFLSEKSLTVVVINRSIQDIKKSSLKHKGPWLQDFTKPKSFLNEVTSLVQEYFSAEHSDVSLVPWL